MNSRRPGHDPSHADGTADEWALQERAMRDVRAGAGDGAEDPDLAAYRRIARALRTPPAGRLPSNFAFQVAQFAARLPRASRLDLRLERWLERSLAAAMALGALVVGGVYGMDWLRTLESTDPGVAGWVGALAACLLLTWGMQGLRAPRSGVDR